MGAKAQSIVEAGVKYLSTSTNLPRVVMSMILLGYGERLHFGYLRAMQSVDSFIANTIGIEVSRGMKDQGTSTAADVELPPLNFFGANLSTTDAMTVAAQIDATLSLSVGALLGADGQRSLHAERLLRATSASMYATAIIEKYEGPAAAGLAFAGTIKHAMRGEGGDIHDRMQTLGVLNMEDLARYIYDTLLRSNDAVLNGDSVDAAGRPLVDPSLTPTR